MICPVCGKKNVLGVDTCARCGVTLKVLAERLAGSGSQVIQMGILEEEERLRESEGRPEAHAQSIIRTDSSGEQEVHR